MTHGEDDLEGTITWSELLDGAAATLRRAGIGSAEMDARRIVGEASGVDVAAMPSGLDSLATVRGVAHLDDMVRRRAEGEPLQYVLGSWGFRTLDLMVDRRVLIPRPETETVVDFALAELDRCGGRSTPTEVLDLGTGSGAIALSIAVERPRATVWAVDISPDALAVAAANTVGIGRSGARVTLLEGDLFDPLPPTMQGTFDLVVSNPPYVATDIDVPASVTEWEPPVALWSGAAGTDALRRLIDEAPRWLTDDGALVAELSPEQADEMAALALGRFQEVAIGDDLTGRARALIARRPGGRPG